MKLHKSFALFAAGTGLIMAIPVKANLILDGDFSVPNQGTSSTSYTYAPTGSPWTFSALENDVSGSGITYIPSNFQNSPLGIQVGFLQTVGGSLSSDPASISQLFSAPTAGTYDLSFSYAGRSYDGGTTTFTVSVDGHVVDTLTPSSGQPLTSQSVSVSLVSGLNNTLAFTATGVSGNDETAFIDKVSVTAVPEPTTVIAGALLLLPFGASTIRVLRRNRAA